jgi:hypothetical protein
MTCISRCRSSLEWLKNFAGNEHLEEKSWLCACNQIQFACTLPYSDSILSMLMLILSPPLLIRLWRALLLLIAAFALTQGRASAECGDYITIRHAARVANQHESMPWTVPPTLNDIKNTVPENLPCRGPNCSRSPGQNLPPLAPVAPVISLAKGLIQDIQPIDEATQHSPLARDFTFILPINRPFPIFHPPRD